MSEEENINDFNGKLCNVDNESFALREKIPKEKLVKKALRSLSPRFANKATTIREVKELKRMRLEELKGSLLTFEIKMNEVSTERKKLVGLRAEFELLVDEENELSESMALMSKNFERAIKRLNAQVKGNPQIGKIAFSTLNPTKFGRTQGSLGQNIKNQSIQCRECGSH